MDEKENRKKLIELEDQYDQLHSGYLKEKFEIIDSKRDELRKLKVKYKYDRLNIRTPLKAEKYRLKMEKKEEIRKLNEPPKRDVLEEIGNSVTHGVGAIIAIVFLILMLLKSDTPLKVVAAVIYNGCLFFMMLASCLYHAFRQGTNVKRLFRKFDYTSIYLLIGGTFAPLYLVYWGDTKGIIFFAIQWTLIAVGITMIGVFGPGRLKWLHFPMYFVIGWSGLMFIPQWIQSNLGLLLWVLIGGVVYSAGMIPFAIFSKRKVAHFIWHFFVLIGAILQWIGIFLYVF